jgi:hypothetical protein
MIVISDFMDVFENFNNLRHDDNSLYEFFDDDWNLHYFLLGDDDGVSGFLYQLVNDVEGLCDHVDVFIHLF